jgi:L-lactate dehydrogenase (cytochrome)
MHDHALRPLARAGAARLQTRFLYDYIGANIVELQATQLRQRVMVDESHLNLSIELWDQKLSLPVVLGPVGMAGMYSSRGEVKAANAVKAAEM